LGSCHEEIPEIVLNSSRGDDRIRGFKRTHVRTRRGCRKYHELPGLLAAASGIQATGVTPRRAAVCDPIDANGGIGVSTDVL
jgi:hypothetical protein